MPDYDVQDAGALFHIAEPERPALTHKRAPGKGIGIDLGTTHSLVAIAPNGAVPRVLCDEQGRALIPSVVSYVDSGTRVGYEARAQQIAYPERVLSSIKRFMGRGARDIDFPHPYRLVGDTEHERDLIRINVGDGRVVTPVEVSAVILERLKHRAEAELGTIDGAVITVPAYFDEAQRQATKDAGSIAGLEVYRLLAEPTAAALAYGLDKGSRGLFAVYDFGGGTFDISLLRLHDGVFQVLATGGDTALGGDDLDRAIARVLLGGAGVERPSAQQWEEAIQAARHAKERLSEENVVDVDLDTVNLHGRVLRRDELEAIIEPIVRRTVAPCRQALKDAGIHTSELTGVVLVGGSTRVPLVRNLVARTFAQTPLCDIDPDKVVAYGAAIQADVLSGSARDGITLLDVVPLSLGIETMGGIVEKIIPRNATIPISARQVFTNYSEQQTGMVVHVVQGERELTRDCRSLARFELRGLPKLPPSMARVEVTFQLDADALLTVTARELMTGTKQTVEVRPTYGLSETEIDRLVTDSLVHAQDDFAARSVAEIRVELGRVVLAVSTAVREVGHIESVLPKHERSMVEAALAEANALMASNDAPADALRRTLEGLERVSEPFARRRMERALRAGMQGRSLSDIEQALADEHELNERRGGHEAELVPRPEGH